MKEEAEVTKNPFLMILEFRRVLFLFYSLILLFQFSLTFNLFTPFITNTLDLIACENHIRCLCKKLFLCFCKIGGGSLYQPVLCFPLKKHHHIRTEFTRYLIGYFLFYSPLFYLLTGHHALNIFHNFHSIIAFYL